MIQVQNRRAMSQDSSIIGGVINVTKVDLDDDILMKIQKDENIGVENFFGCSYEFKAA